MPEHKRIGRNMGRIELLAVRDTVNTMLEAGYDLKKIHGRLMEEGRITMSYPTFCYQFKQRFMGAAAPDAVPVPPRRPEPSGRRKADKSESFGLNSNPQYKDFQ
jgi:hypothetical protein